MKVANGLGVSQGKAKGKVKIIRELADHAHFQQGDILVTHITDPTMVILMGKAAGIVCDIGSMVSHPAILSREMGVPCVVQASCIKTSKPATELLQDGDIIEIDGLTGDIYKHEQ